MSSAVLCWALITLFVESHHRTLQGESENPVLPRLFAFHRDRRWQAVTGAQDRPGDHAHATVDSACSS